MPSLRVRSHKRDLRRFGGTPPGSAPPSDAEQRRFHDRLTNRRQRANKVPLVVNAADVEYEREQS
jgi:hypothetical protein